MLALTAARAWLQKRAGLLVTDYIPLDEIRRPDRALVILIIGAGICYLVLTAVLYFAVAKSSGYYKLDFEASHFLWRLKLMATYGLRPYRDFVCEHGPALVYGPAWLYSALRPFGVSPEAAYYILNYLLNLFGLAALLQLVNSLAMPVRFKLIAFALVVISAFSPSMGLSGLLIRYLLPFWSLLLVHRAAERARPNGPRYRLAALVAVTSFISVAISAEIGIATAVALSVYALLIFQVDRIGALHILVSEAAVVVASVLVLPAEYLHTLASVSQGGNNFPIVPALHILFYVTLILLCVPRLLIPRFSRSSAAASYGCAQGILILATAPAALSRCDPPHVILYGFGLFIIAFAMFAQQGRRRFFAYTLAYMLVAIVLFEWSNAQYYGLSLAKLSAGTHRILAFLHVPSRHGTSTVQATTQSASPSAVPSFVGLTPKPFDLASFDKYPALGLPYGSYGYDRVLQNYLWQEKKIVPQRYMGALAVYTEPQLRDALADLSRIRYIVVQQYFLALAHSDKNACNGQVAGLKWALVYPFAPPCVQRALAPDAEIALFIQSHYRPVEQIGDYIIYERNQ